ncbi:MAG: mechanosensitive ion channel family protein [Gemmatimonadaceae bacterium]|nr:mechanosensitive ion channel family protein [Gemmatimonadaceae bacterium]
MSLPFLDRIVAGNSLGTWLLGLAAALGVWVALTSGRQALVRRLSGLAERTETAVDDAVVEVLRRTRGWFVLAMCLGAASALVQLPARAGTWLHRGLVLVALVQGGLWANAVVRLWLERTIAARGASGRTALEAVGLAGRLGLWTVLLLLALDNLGVNITALVTGLGITGIAVALAVQNVLGDALASLSIVLDKPFEVGDAIAVDQFEGVVEHIGLKTTRVRSFDGEQLIFANAELLKARIRNLQRRTERRVVLVHTLDPSADPAALDGLGERVRGVIAEHEALRFDRAALRAVTPEGLEFETVYWIASADFAAHIAARDAVLRGTHRVLRDLGLGYASADVTAARRLATRAASPSTTAAGR